MNYNIQVVLLVSLSVLVWSRENHQRWDVAVVVKDQLKLLAAEGSALVVVAETPHSFNELKALGYDNHLQQFIVSDEDVYRNDSISFVNFLPNNETKITPVIENLPDDVNGIVINPLTNKLYWTDTKNKTISFAPLNTTDLTVDSFDVLTSFDEEIPRAVAIDVCKGYIYWTNVDQEKPTIDRCRLDGTDRKSVIDTDLEQPRGIAIDVYTDRLFWADSRLGIYYRIESANLDGQDRRLVYAGTHSTPRSIAVSEFDIYWTDTANKGVSRISKMRGKSSTQPELMIQFHDYPNGIVTNTPITSSESCNILSADYILSAETPKETDNTQATVKTCKCKNSM